MACNVLNEMIERQEEADYTTTWRVYDTYHEVWREVAVHNGELQVGNKTIVMCDNTKSLRRLAEYYVIKVVAGGFRGWFPDLDDD